MEFAIHERLQLTVFRRSTSSAEVDAVLVFDGGHKWGEIVRVALGLVQAR